MVAIEQTGSERLDDFVAKVREATGVCRIAIFLDAAVQARFVPRAKDRFLCAHAVGISQDLCSRVALLKQSGIGHWVTHYGTVLRRYDFNSMLAPAEREKILREFEILSCEVAIPITDRETVLGVALLGSPVTRNDFNEQELRELFYQMEELGLIIRRSQERAHETRDNALLTQVLASIRSGILVVTSDLTIIKSNPAVRDYLNLPPGEAIEFDQIPARLATQIRGALELRDLPDPFFLSFPSDPQKRTFRITLTRLENSGDVHDGWVVVILDDLTGFEVEKKAAVEAATSRLRTHIRLLGGDYAAMASLHVEDSTTPITSPQNA